jgi:hypothetical protein
MSKSIANHFRNPHLQRVIAKHRLDSSTLQTIATAQGFPVELMPSGLCDFLELELLKILQATSAIPVNQPSVQCHSLAEVLKHQESQVHLTDMFFLEFFDKLPSGIDGNLYDQIFKSLSQIGRDNEPFC